MNRLNKPIYISLSKSVSDLQREFIISASEKSVSSIIDIDIDEYLLNNNLVSEISLILHEQTTLLL